MKKYVLVNKRAYDILADEYAQRITNKSEFEEPVDNLVGLPLDYASRKFKILSVLDIGPGRGEASRYISERGHKTTALDISKKMLDVVKLYSPKTDVITADILSYQIPNKAYELIYCGALIHLFNKLDAIRIMKNIFSGLKQNGILFVNTTIHDESEEGYYVKKDYVGNIKRYRHRYTLQEFEDLIKSSGFKIIDTINTYEEDREKHWIGFICQK